MESTIEFEIDLFAGSSPSMDEIRKLSEFVHSSEVNLIAFSEQVEENMDKTGPKVFLAAGISLFILGRSAEAVEKLTKAKDCKEKFIYLAFALRRIGQFDQAIESLQNSLNYKADTLTITLEKVAGVDNPALYKIADIDQLDYIVTDTCPARAWQIVARKKSIKLIYPKDSKSK